MITSKFNLALCIMVALFYGCSPNYYIPNTQNVPAIKAKGQTSLSVAGNGNQVEFQGAYGLTNQLALQINGGLVVPEDKDNGNGGSGKFIEAGLGYYKNITSNWLFDTYGLIGLGHMKNHFPGTLSDHPSTTGNISANLLRFGIQPGLTYQRKYFSISASARILGLNYSDINGSLIFNNENQVAYLHDNQSNFLIEPALTLRGGLEKIKLQVQLMKSLNLSNHDFRQDDALLTIGLDFNFN